jgi:YebC/PmpR family DNA-binding regulatory protein
MAGHSKWANIKHRKAAQDAKRGKIFTKLIRELVVAARAGGGVPEDNPRLRTAMDKALAANMKKDTVERAIERGAGNSDDDNYVELTYEGYGVNGVAVYVEAMTDNRNRIVAEVRHAFNKFGGNLGTDGSVAYLFTKQGTLTFGPDADEERIMEAALESGAEDIATSEDGSIDVVTTPETYLVVKEALRRAGLEPEASEVSMVPSTWIPLDSEGAEKVLKLIDTLEDLDDVQNVYHNAELPDEVLDG